MISASENIKSISPYVPGKPIEEVERELGISGTIKLASNENPLGPSSKAISAVKKALEGLHRYPDGSGFYLSQALAKKYKVNDSQIILGNGSNELIELVVRTFVQPGDEVVSADPSFVVYKMITQAAGGIECYRAVQGHAAQSRSHGRTDLAEDKNRIHRKSEQSYRHHEHQGGDGRIYAAGS